jgi:hypothetical protein
MKVQVGGILTQPFNQVNLSEMLERPPLPIDFGERPAPGVVLRRLAARHLGRPNGRAGRRKARTSPAWPSTGRCSY